MSVKVAKSDRLLVGGSFLSIGGAARTSIARLDASTGLADSFSPNASRPVQSIAVQADGKILAGGLFTSIGGQTRTNIARLDASTGLADLFDPKLNASIGNSVNSIVVQADGKILAVGSFTTLAPNRGPPVTRNRIARLEADGRLDQTLDLNTVGEYVFTTAVQPDGKILLAGGFTTVLGVARTNIARLNTDGTLDTAFNPNANNFVQPIAVQADGKILVGGDFNGIGGQTRNRIARLESATGLADSFNPDASFVYSIAVQADGKILACGGFTSIGGQTRNRIARLDATTGLADSFNPNASGGAFIPVRSIAVQADGKILAGGEFTTIGGQPRNLFARLSNDTAALQNLAVTQTTISWMLGGSSPQFTRVPFEYSTDNVNYTPLGDGTASGSKWTLTGLSLSTGLNFYIRARGYYRNGQSDGSESIRESVRIVFLTPQPSILNIQRNANTNIVLS